MILLVDGDPGFLERCEALLAADELVYFALDAESARGLLATVGAAFTVVLININLPGSTGLELIRDIRRWAPELPVIAIGGEDPGENPEAAHSMGVAATVRKPITGEWRTAISRARGRAAAGSGAAG